MAQKPVIISIDKESTAGDEIVTIKGNAFDYNQANLKVSFGAAVATIKTATPQLLEVSTPFGTTYDQISVTNLTNGLTSYSSEQHLLSFHGDQGLNTQDFSGQQDFSAESGLYDLCVCDFNNDGKNDVITASDNSNSISIFQNGSNAGSISLTTTTKLINAKSLHITCSDLNGDGLSDIVLSEGGNASRIFIFKNNGNFNFTAQNKVLTGRKVKRVSIADLDLDGKPEIIVTDKGSNILSILKNQSTMGAISFSAPVQLAVNGAATTDALEVKDLNNDGLAEIITSQFNTTISYVFIFINHSTPGNIVLDDMITLNADNTLVNIKIGDLDNDKKPDITATRFSGSDIIIFRNQLSNGTLSFSLPVSITTNVRPAGLDFGDLDGDGKLDIAIASIEHKSITVLNNKSTPGTFSFSPFITLTTNFINRHVRIGDIDTDGKPDIAFTSIDDNNTGVLASKLSIIRNKVCMIPELTPAGPLTICSGFPLMLTATSNKGITYNWKRDGTTISSIPDNVLSNVSTSGGYSVEAIAESATCAKLSNTVNISIITAGSSLNATPPDARSNSPVCTKDILNLQVNDVGATAYRWSGPNGFTAVGLTPSQSNFAIENAGEYIVEMMIGSCVANTDTTIVEGIIIPDFQITYSGSESMCEGTSKTLTVSPLITSGFTYQWYEQTSGALALQTGASLVASSSGEYYIRGTSSQPVCAPVETPHITIKELSIPQAAFSINPTTACVGTEVVFTDQTVTDASAIPLYSWSFGSTTAQATHTFTNTNPSQQIQFTVSYQEVPSCTDIVSKNIAIVDAIKPDIIASRDAICEGGSSALSISSSSSYNSIQWSTGESLPDITVQSPGAYSVTTVDTNGCTSTDVITVASDQFEIEINANKLIIPPDGVVELTASGADIYLWTPSETLSDSTIANPVAQPQTTTLYTVTGTNYEGCISTANITITVSTELVNIVPSPMFSPNGDDDNPVWVIAGIENYPGCSLNVFDGRGRRVYEKVGYMNQWDGTYNGAQLPEGVYFFVFGCENKKPITGSVLIIR